MNELERIVREANRLTAEGSSYLLATLVRVRGSSYRRPGARMLVARDRWVAGCVSGGCLESDVLLRGMHRCRAGAALVPYDSTDDADGWGLGLGCNGVVELLLERVEPATVHEGIAFAKACFDAEQPGVLVTVIESSCPDAPLGARFGIGPGGERLRATENAAIVRAFEEAARGAPGVVALAGIGITAFVERIEPSPQLFVLGSGHDTVPLVTLAQSIGMRVTVADRVVRDPLRLAAADRLMATAGDWMPVAALIDAAASAYVVVMHHQRDADRDGLRIALESRARYIGVLGPARRTRELLAEIGADAHDPRLHAPVGLAIGAETPEQIALAIVAELQANRRGAAAGELRERKRSLHAEVAIAVLAAGASRRLGRPKQLVEIEGVPLVRRVLAECVDSAAGPVAVVVGAGAPAVKAACGGLGDASVFNDEWPSGIASSIRAAVRWAESTSAEALLLVLGDQPMLTTGHLAAMREAWLMGADYVASRFGTILGAPALFDRSRWSELTRLEGDEGAARLLRSRQVSAQVAAIDWPAGAFDIDTEEDVCVVQAMAGKSPINLSSVIG